MLGKFSILFLLTVYVAIANADVFDRADKAAQKQQANIAVEETVSVPFDEPQAKKAMELGEATIKGVLYHRLKLRADYAGEPIGWTKAQEVLMPDVDVYLFPANAHLKEQRRLENENKKQRLKSNTVQLKSYIVDPRMFNYMLHTKTDAQGRFHFNQLKPGRYYVSANDQVVTLIGWEKVKVGESGGAYSDGHGGGAVGVNHYEDRHYEIQKPLLYETEFEVKSGQKEFKMDAQMNPPNVERGLRGLFD